MFAVITMLAKTLKFLTAFIILLHCLGATQLMSACAKNQAAFVSMLNMTEEETKKEKESDSEDGLEFFHETRNKFSVLQSNFFTVVQSIYFHDSLKQICYQFVVESPTPPPDFCA